MVLLIGTITFSSPMSLSQVSFFSKIDFEQLDLPSNRLSVGHLRKHFPDRAEFVMEQEGNRLDALWDEERTIVLLGYASILGKEAEGEVRRQYGQPDKAVLINDLTNDLVHYGLADGPTTAMEIAKGLEKAGAEIAREQLGRRLP
jgi:hypothetical protein